jgi:quinol monooxygenase YgiN
VPDHGSDKLVIAVDLVIGEDLEHFMALMAVNAARSLRDEPGCRQFDVCVDSTNAGQLFLYEIYDDEAAFAAHLVSPHYRTFDAATADLILCKDVRRYWLKAG